MSDINSFLTSGGTNTFATLTAVSTTPGTGKKHVIGSWIIANISGASLSVDCVITRSAVNYYQVKGFTIQAGDSLFLHGLLGKVVLLAGDVCKVLCSVSGGVDVTFSIAEEP